MVSIVMPVHNEAGRLAEVLAPVQKVIRDKKWQAVIICNGCTDDSAAIARSFDAFTVLESEIPSKVCALNLGDQHAKFGARIYMDSDLTITSRDLMALGEHLVVEKSVLVSPVMRVEVSGSSWLVRKFHEFWTRLPAYEARTGGLYGLSAKGRDRFGEFPELNADDGYVRSLFHEGEFIKVPDIVFSSFAPRSLSGLLAIRRRAKQGNKILQDFNDGRLGAKQNQIGDVFALMVTSPRFAVAGLVFLGITLWVQIQLRIQKGMGREPSWERDESSRKRSAA